MTMHNRRKRVAWIVLAVSELVFLVLGAAWLWISTRTSQLVNTVKQLDERREALREEINALWIELGEQTSLNVMERRARELNFAPARAKEYADAEAQR